MSSALEGTALQYWFVVCPLSASLTYQEMYVSGVGKLFSPEHLCMKLREETLLCFTALKIRLGVQLTVHTT